MSMLVLGVILYWHMMRFITVTFSQFTLTVSNIELLYLEKSPQFWLQTNSAHWFYYIQFAAIPYLEAFKNSCLICMYIYLWKFLSFKPCVIFLANVSNFSILLFTSGLSIFLHEWSQSLLYLNTISAETYWIFYLANLTPVCIEYSVAQV